MGIFSRKKTEEAPTAPASAPEPSSGGISFTKSSGKISLDKGSAGPVMIKKTSKVKATASWSSKTDYDLYAYIVLRSGEVVSVATFAAGNQEPARSGWSGKGRVTHCGDVGREAKGDAVEIIEIEMGDDVVAVVPVAYSAQSNGSGSFYRYQVGLAIDNGAGDVVSIDSREASRNDGIFTLVPGVIYNHPEGVVVERLELYSRGGEKRPRVSLGKDGRVRVEMDAGPRNDYK